MFFVGEGVTGQKKICRKAAVKRPSCQFGSIKRKPASRSFSLRVLFAILLVAQGWDSVLEAAPSGGPGFRRILRRDVYARSGQF
ncbi:hypothetical protein GCM10007870_10580 [Gluconobacter kondonii]|uniref:Uncharacterized protein n=1 Tax=Gluconobacter kondonii TaxID=941463 RepID=A0ABQ5WS27_9PROT|nr:hypothetical protein GCM10007870_10580 [Gluconobacter kondonii]